MNEIQHLKIGFSSFAAGIEAGPEAERQIEELQRSYLTFAKVQRGEEASWELIRSNINWLSIGSMMRYRAGPVYEIESGARLYHGKRINAERYLDYYDALPSVCISQLPSYGLQAWMMFDSLQEEMERKSAQGIEFASAVTYEVEGCEQVKAEVPLTSAKQIFYFLNSYCRGKEIRLLLGREGLEQATPAPLVDALPRYTETLSLF
ncbi:hypothetical protein V8Z74_14730 [Comamonas sp. w2-DMI]|uniref:hypothetical protein n=1 Tax=Comamonas sp. w2-DMI TaxID=3126391 RepID=UPI0032E4BB41